MKSDEGALLARHLRGGVTFQIHVHVLQRPVLRLCWGRDNVLLTFTFRGIGFSGACMVAMISGQESE